MTNEFSKVNFPSNSIENIKLSMRILDGTDAIISKADECGINCDEAKEMSKTCRYVNENVLKHFFGEGNKTGD